MIKTIISKNELILVNSNALAFKNHLLLDRYKLLVEKLYCEPKDEVIIGNYLTPITELLNVDRRPENKRTERNKRKVENS